MSAPFFDNETERLQTLHNYQILDTPSEVAFNRLTSLASKLFDAPITLVSLVDSNRQWFKACIGLDLSQTERRLSFCAHAIASDQVMTVPDAATDPRFASNDLVTGAPHIRSYMGAPLKAPNGHRLGTLCVIDRVPREFNAQQSSMLADLADIVVDELELRRAANQVREKEAHLHEALYRNSQLMLTVTHLTSGVAISDPEQPDNPIIFANAGFYSMTGYSPQEVIGHNIRFLQGPQTNPAIVEEMHNAIAEQRPFSGTLINYRKDGTPFVNELAVNPVFDEAGRLMNFVAVQNDVTEREHSKQLLEWRVQERTLELADSQMEILDRLARATEFRDDDTGQHTQRVSHMAASLAHELGFSPEQVVLMRQAAPLHDVGKIAIPDNILLKQGKLTPEEFAIMKTHASIGAALLSNGHSEAVQMAERIAGNHHERWDGRGYPNGLAGEAIPLEGRILAIADVFDALTHERPYKSAWPIPEAIAEIQRCAGTQFDPRVVEAFSRLNHEEFV